MQQLPECQLILDKLKIELPVHLFYHSIHRTFDVYHCAESIAKEEGISSSDLKLLHVAAIYHDAGYLKQNKDHEELSYAVAREYLPLHKYTNCQSIFWKRLCFNRFWKRVLLLFLIFLALTWHI
ncbi:MAG: hypothetical protein ACI87N_003366 [Flavobacteriales bacterium]|jgi:uncharacterized protein